MYFCQRAPGEDQEGIIEIFEEAAANITKEHVKQG